MKDIWDRLRGKVEKDPRAAGAVQDLAEMPEDEDVRAALRVQLRKLLEADPALAADLAPRVEAITNVHAQDRAVVAMQGGVAEPDVCLPQPGVAALRVHGNGAGSVR